MLKKILKISVVTISILLLLFIGGNIYLHHWLNKQLPLILNHSPDRAYDIRYRDFSFNFYTHDLVINGIIIVPVDHVGKSPGDSTVIEAAANQFIMRDVHLIKLVFRKEIYTRHLFISHPAVRLDIVPGKKSPEDSLQVKIFLRDFFNRIRVANVDLRQANFAINNRRTSSPIFTIGPFDLHLQNVIADSSTVTSPFPFRYHEVSLKGKLAAYHIGSFYILRIPHYQLENGDVTLDSAVLDPIYNEREYQHQIKFQHDWYQLAVQKINIKNGIWGFMPDKPFIHIQALGLKDMDLLVYRDKRLLSAPSGKKDLLQTFLQKLSFQLTIDSIRVLDSKVAYEEHSDAPRSAGKLVFDKIFCNAVHLSNDSLQIRRNPDFVAKTNSRFMNAASLKADFVFQLASPADQFSVNGHLGEMKAEIVNKVLLPLTGISASGQIYGIDFNIAGNDRRADNKMSFFYDSLFLDVSQQDKKLKSMLLTALLNIFVRNRNMRGDDDFYQVKFDINHDENHSYFNYLWLCIKSGLLYTMIDTQHGKFEKWQAQKLLNKLISGDSGGK